MNSIKKYTLGEEIANSITHGIGALLSIAGLVILIVFSSLYGNAWDIVSFTIFGCSLVLLYTSSTLYHSISNLKAKSVFKIFDHVSIFILIAGSYTPFLLTNLRGLSGWIFFAVVWSLALVGIIQKTLYIGKYKKLSLFTYLFMGWLCVFILKPMIHDFSPLTIRLLAYGGIAYTVGVILYVRRKKYSHTIWHIFVLLGSIFQFFSVLSILKP